MMDTIRNKLDDRGVSPVIGVILMVAITVILAAVIGSFVLGIGGDLNTAEQASISFSDHSGDASAGEYFVLSHNGGDTITDGEIIVRNESGNQGTNDTFGEFAPGDTLSVGNDSAAADVLIETDLADDKEYTIQVLSGDSVIAQSTVELE
ncbi:hypothetical protein HTSR_0101 [Halodesulfurarchaeum formicicum]|uniref:Archaeal Type IV pilin N-terminal domain-containing protein n=1 Tax=Halodesulfurarchaeum formicicum TaxID=1873524 RepID=A0A1D8S1W4_9EURY|nr:type IV pilin N-terminal domain-containing protein [Halodesulfurarchaeum formicicum]AOW79311.1 hypothetical protein HTSR_0101 [Halodesulfurarchaeum formicicum]